MYFFFHSNGSSNFKAIESYLQLQNHQISSGFEKPVQQSVHGSGTKNMFTSDIVASKLENPLQNVYWKKKLFWNEYLFVASLLNTDLHVDKFLFIQFIIE